MAKEDEFPNMEIYWTTREIAQRLKKSPECVKKWLGSGRLRKTKAGSSTLISETDLQAFLSESTRQAAA